MATKKALWSGGFSEKMHPDLAAISDSLEQDFPLADADFRASSVYALALARCGVLNPVEGEKLARTLEELRVEFLNGQWLPHAVEDIHTAIEDEVTLRLGELGARLHTGRSRNDQVSTAFRLSVSVFIDSLVLDITALLVQIAKRATCEVDTLVPAYTHMQRAQPVRLAHWILGYFWPLTRDIERLLEVKVRVLQLPLGAGAVSGHPFGLDRNWVAEQLGFYGVTQNSIDTVGDRDFALEVTHASYMVSMHLSRMADELVMWSSAEFGYITWPDALASGSSLMPNKKNPDLVELVRGRVGSAAGNVMSLMMLLKGLPQSYQRDLQEDKMPVWDSFKTTSLSVRAMTAAWSDMIFMPERMSASLSDDVLATEAADVLVTRGVPFRKAYKAVAMMAAEARKRGVGLKSLAMASDYVLPELVSKEDIEGLSVEAATERRTSVGGTARSAVELQLRDAYHFLEEVSQLFGVPQ